MWKRVPGGSAIRISTCVCDVTPWCMEYPTKHLRYVSWEIVFSFDVCSLIQTGNNLVVS